LVEIIQNIVQLFRKQLFSFFVLYMYKSNITMFGRNHVNG